MINYIGILGSILLAICSLPQVYQSVKTKSSEGISSMFLLLWGLGEALIIVYVLGTTRDPILLVNYFFNFLFVAIIAYYKLPPKFRIK